MLDLKLQDKIPCSEIRKRAKIIDIMEYTPKQKSKWAGHIARMKDNMVDQTLHRVATKERGRDQEDDQSEDGKATLTGKEGTTWIRKATDKRQWKTLMEGYILQWMYKA